jgi:probable rRNA maturation factor
VPFLRRHLRRALLLLPCSLRELSIALVNDRTMSRLHKRFMNLASPTDVLTFPLELNRAGTATIGEVVICAPYATRSAKEHRIPVQNELLLYALHGVLHLCGFDDRTPAGFREMHRKEDAILTRLGVGPVFDAPAKRRRS